MSINSNSVNSSFQAHSFTGSLVPCSNMWPTRAKKLLTVHIQTLDVDMEFSVPVGFQSRLSFFWLKLFLVPCLFAPNAQKGIDKGKKSTRFWEQCIVGWNTRGFKNRPGNWCALTFPPSIHDKTCWHVIVIARKFLGNCAPLPNF